MNQPISDEEFEKALHEVVTSLAERADAERAKEKPYQDLFAASQNGLKSLLSKTSDQMSHIAHSTTDIIRKQFKINTVSKKLFDLIKALPFAMWDLRCYIDTQEMGCCADKARDIYYQEVLAEIQRIQKKEG